MTEPFAGGRAKPCRAWVTIRRTRKCAPTSLFDMTLSTWRADTFPRASSASPRASTPQNAVTIAVVDDAVDTRHPEFAGRIAGQWDAETGAHSSIPNGWQPHGTKVAGLALAGGP